MRPSQRRELAAAVVDAGRTSIRHACVTFDVSETAYRYVPRRLDEDALIADWLVRLTTAFRDWGFGLCFLHLRNVKGFAWNHKRVYRIYRELELNLRIKPKKRLVREVPQPLSVPAGINEVWSIDFMHDALVDSRSLQNAYVERYNRTVRYGWLNQCAFETIEQVQETATRWLWTYNHERPNMALGGITPMQRLARAA